MHKLLKTPITPSILKFLINSGYEYCLSRCSYTGNAVSSVLLTPVKKRPDLKLIQHYDALLLTCEEPLQMACGADGPPVMIELEMSSLAHFVGYLFNGQNKACQL